MDLKNLKVLYIEDDEMTRESLTYYLKKRLGKVYSVSNGEKALWSYETYHPDIIIIDLVLPDISGVEIIRRIREKDAACRIIVTSSLDDTGTILDSVGAGIDDYMIKPIDLDQLIQKIQAAARTYEQLKGKALASSISTPKGKAEAESAIRTDLIKMIKSESGRGPRDLTVSWIGDEITIVIYDAQTVMEKTLYADIKNHTFLQQFRMLFYNTLMGSIEEILQKYTKLQVSHHSAQIDIQRHTDTLKYHLESE